MANSTTSTVYAHVIEDVINKCRDEYTDNGGPGDNVLNELQAVMIFYFDLVPNNFLVQLNKFVASLSFLGLF